MSPLARVLIAFIVWTAATALIAPICFAIVVVLAGPHSSVLPSAVQPAVLVLGWLAVFAVPPWAAWRVWRRTGRAS